ncbi:MAG: hypothetical protein GY832_05010 [Chloroflexi bacterium]|nr:hypothetical protein [Chloroflexota bacterium]
MSEFDSEPREAPTPSPGIQGNTVAIIAIAAATIVALACMCIASTTIITVAFFTNAPW